MSLLTKYIYIYNLFSLCTRHPLRCRTIFTWWVYKALACCCLSSLCPCESLLLPCGTVQAANASMFVFFSNTKIWSAITVGSGLLWGRDFCLQCRQYSLGFPLAIPLLNLAAYAFLSTWSVCTSVCLCCMCVVLDFQVAEESSDHFFNPSLFP